MLGLNWPDLNAALDSAARLGHSNDISILLDKGAHILTLNQLGDTPLHTAARSGHINVICFLLDKGAHVNLHNKEDWLTPLHEAVLFGKTDVICFLLDMEANVKILGIDGATPLKLAKKIQAKHRSINNKTQRDLAREIEVTSCVTLLESPG